MQVQVKNNRIVIRTKYDIETIEKIKLIPGRKWNKYSRVWTLPGEQLEALRIMFPNATGKRNLCFDLNWRYNIWIKWKNAD